MKKRLLITVLFVLIAGIVFAQEDDFFGEVRGNPGLDWRADVKKNWISFEVGIDYYGSAGFRYERMINAKMSLGLHGYFSPAISTYALYANNTNDTGIDAAFRWYPNGRYFYLETGLGFHYIPKAGTSAVEYNSPIPYGSNTTFYTGYDLMGVGIPLELGWKIDPGRAGVFFISYGFAGTFVIGKKILADNLSDISGISVKGLGIGGSIRAFFAMGWGI